MKIKKCDQCKRIIDGTYFFFTCGDIEKTLCSIICINEMLRQEGLVEQKKDSK